MTKDFPTQLKSSSDAAEVLETIRAVEQDASSKPTLSSTGQKVLEKADVVLADTADLIRTKAPVEPFQEALAHGERATKILESKEGRSGLKKWTESIVDRKDATKAIEAMGHGGQALLDAIQLIISSSEFRNVLVEFMGIVQDVLKTKDNEESDTTYSDLPEQVETNETENLDVEKDYGEVLADEKVSQIAQASIRAFKLIQGKKEYQDAINQLINQFALLQVCLKPEGITSKLQQLLTISKEERSALELAFNESLEATKKAKQLIEQWIDGSLDPLIDASNEFIDKASNDDELYRLLHEFEEWLGTDVKEFLLSAQDQQDDKENQPGTNAPDIPDDLKEMDKRVREFIRDVRKTLLPKYQRPIEKLMAETRYMMEKLKRDPLSRKLKDDLTGLLNELFYDKTGKLTLKPELLGDLQTILPAVIRKLECINIPSVSITQPDLSFQCTDIAVRVGEVVPKHIKISYLTDVFPSGESTEPAIDLGKMDKLVLGQAIVIELDRIHGEARNFCFWIDKRSLPSLLDQGLADLRVYGGRGMSIRLILIPHMNNGGGASLTKTEGQGEDETKVRPSLQIAKCTCRIDELDLTLHHSQHDWLYFFLGPFIRRYVKRLIEEEIENWFVSAAGNLQPPTLPTI